MAKDSLLVKINEPPQPDYKSKWEREFAWMLQTQKLTREIREYRYEGYKLKLAKGAWYTPDFVVFQNDGTMVFYEVKGYRREAGIVRLKVASRLYPWHPFIIVTRRKGAWEYERIMGV